MNIATNANETHSLNESILRAYDIRGIVGKTLGVEDARLIGQAFATCVARKSGKKSPVIAIGYDGRESSPDLSAALVKGILSTGADVRNVGLGPTPMLYFAVRKNGLDGGVMVTGSHNPPDHNGFKMMLSKEALYGEQIQELGAMIKTGDFASGKGAEQTLDMRKAYVATLLEGYEAGGRALKIAWDPGNGAAGEITEMLCAKAPAPEKQHIINASIDSSFPNHHPDPSREENMEQLKALVLKEKCDFGVAFDGDGDRVGVVDSKGRMVANDFIVALYAREILQKLPGATIIADVKASQVLFDDIAKHGGKPLMWKTGHSLVKAKMLETGSPFAGEMSGHIFFADKYYGFDDGIYAAVRLINIVAHADISLAEMVDSFPILYNTPEIRIACAEERKFKVVEEIKAGLVAAKADFSDIVGIRVNMEGGWWLLRASNTGAELVARAEAKAADSLQKLKDELAIMLKEAGISPQEINKHF